jgi:hypothetical protein
VELRGKVSRVVWRDRSFAVVDLICEDGHLRSVSGRIGSVVEDMPLAVEARRRESLESAYGERWAVETVGEVSGAWKRLAGLKALSSVEGSEEERLALVGLERRVSELRWAADHGVEVGETDVALWRAAEVLGGADLDWAVAAAWDSWGPAGPLLAVSNPSLLVLRGVLTSAQAERLKGTSAQDDAEEMVAAVIGRYLVEHGRCVVGSRKAAQLAAEAVGRDLDQVSGLLARRDSVMAPTDVALSVEEAWDAAEQCSRCALDAPWSPPRKPEWVGEGFLDRLVEALSDAGLVVVVTPAGADGEVLADLRRWLGDGAVSVRHADRRGSLVGRWPGGERLDPAVVWLADCHRLSAARLSQELRGVRSGARVVLAGDDWAWAPGGVGGVLADMVGSGPWPVLKLDGSGAAWHLRGGHNLAGVPVIRRATEPLMGIPRLRFDWPGPCQRSEGRQAMVAVGFAGWGAGTTGQLARSEDGWVLETPVGTLRVARHHWSLPGALRAAERRRDGMVR